MARPMRILRPLTLMWCVLALAVPTASAQSGTHTCGDVQLVFRNPDLVPDSTGLIHASGKFFIQFQAIGAKADEIKAFAFSFGPATVDRDESACSLPVWVTGAYIPNYRADRTPDDGFFMGINTTLVPDGMYAAAVHAYDANNNELGRFWASAVVDNCDTQATPAQERCPDDKPQLKRHDTTAPWPVILPGDGKPVKTDSQLTLEFGEPIANLTVSLNGRDISRELVPWEGRAWDDDPIPDYGPAGVGGLLLPPCTQQPPQVCTHWGPAYAWNGRALTDADVLHVVATDLAGNVATKDVHIGSAVASGAITGDLPNLQVTVDRLEASVRPGESAVFRFTMVNSGGGDAHAFAEATAPKGWNATFLPHEPVPAGKTGKQELTVQAPASATLGAYPVHAAITYRRGGEDARSSYNLTVHVVDAQAGPSAGAAGSTSAKGSPAGLVALPALAVAALLVRRPRVGS